MAYEFSLTGTDGKFYDIQRGDFRLTADGIQGLLFPDISRATRKAAALDGQVLIRWKLEPRKMVLPFNVKTRDTARIREFFNSISSIRNSSPYCVVRATNTETGEYRELSIAFQDDGGYRFAIDPTIRMDKLPLTFVADDPWWYGREVVTAYSLADSYQANFFGDNQMGPPFYISPQGGSATINVVNQGDAPAWPIMEIEGPTTQVTFYVSPPNDPEYYAVTYYLVLAAGQKLTIYSEPDRQVALLDDGRNMTRYLSSAEFTAIPHEHDGLGGSTYVSVIVEGAGRARLRFRPPYERGIL